MCMRLLGGGEGGAVGLNRVVVCQTAGKQKNGYLSFRLIVLKGSFVCVGFRLSFKCRHFGFVDGFHQNSNPSFRSLSYNLVLSE